MGHIFRLAAAAIFTVWVTGAIAANGEDGDKQIRAKALNMQFDLLKNAKDRQTAAKAELTIWQLWLQSGNAEVDGVMRQAIESIKLRQMEASLSYLDKVVAMAPGFAEGWNKRATVLYLMGKLDRSLDDVARVLELEPRHFGAISGAGLIQMAQGDIKAALHAFRRAVKIHPFLPRAHSIIPLLERAIGDKPK